MTDDRRASSRYEFPGLVEIISQSLPERQVPEVRDISLSGCYILTTRPLEIQCMVRLRFSLEATEFEVQGVRNSKLGHGMRIKVDESTTAPKSSVELMDS